MNQNLSITVVIPTYNHAHLLRNAIDSVCCQTFTNWEAVVVNNYSEDNTEEVVMSVADPRIQLVNFRNEGVIAASRNHGVKMARGEYIAFLDSDDVWYPEKLERSLKMLAQGYDVVCHAEAWVRNGIIFRQVKYGPVEMSHYHSLLFGRNCLSTSAITVRKSCLEAVGGFSEDSAFVTVEDYDLWLKLSKAGFNFAFIDEIFGEYTIHETNNSRSVMRQMHAELAVLGKHFSELESWSVTDRLLRFRRLARVYLSYSARWLKLK